MKRVLCLIFISQLTGCLRVVPFYYAGDFSFVPYIQTIQKADTIGHTDPVQRKQDLYACGVNQKANLDDRHWGLNGSEPEETTEQLMEKRNKIETCMKNKGYVLFGFARCGPLKAPTGLCN